jgi:hypothetical protein
MDDTLIYQKIEGLSPDLKKEVFDFVDFILSRQKKVKSHKKPVFGCAKGQFQMTDDFDAPLADFKEYME